MKFENFDLQGCEDPNKMRKDKLARYVCQYCGSKWDDYLRDKALSLGIWRVQASESDPLGLELFAYLEAFRPQHIGFHLPSWETPWNSLSDAAAAFLEAQTGDLAKKKDFRTQHEALPYKQIVTEPVASEYLPAVCELPAQTVPAQAVALTCGIDRQKYGFYFLVRAWARDYTSWLIHYGYLVTWADVERLLFETAYPVDGVNRSMPILRALIDTGGSKFNPDQSMTEETYFWVRRHGIGRGCRVYGVKGASWSQPNKVRSSNPIDKTPSGKPIPGGLRILILDTEKLKDAFFFRLGQAAEGAEKMGAYLHKDTGEDYFKHITAEHKVENDKGVMEWVKKGSQRNDWLDCEMMAAAAADPEFPEGGIHLMPSPKKKKKKDGDPIARKTSKSRRSDRW